MLIYKHVQICTCQRPQNIRKVRRLLPFDCKMFCFEFNFCYIHGASKKSLLAEININIPPSMLKRILILLTNCALIFSWCTDMHSILVRTLYKDIKTKRIIPILSNVIHRALVWQCDVRRSESITHKHL